METVWSSYFLEPLKVAWGTRLSYYSLSISGMFDTGQIRCKESNNKQVTSMPKRLQYFIPDTRFQTVICFKHIWVSVNMQAQVIIVSKHECDSVLAAERHWNFSTARSSKAKKTMTAPSWKQRISPDILQAREILTAQQCWATQARTYQHGVFFPRCLWVKPSRGKLNFKRRKTLSDIFINKKQEN